MRGVSCPAWGLVRVAALKDLQYFLGESAGHELRRLYSRLKLAMQSSFSV